ncbi:hypothetical protein [Pseudomonas weihenstephanensis]|uniref:hypothetical protein n=1 Tax=Pseudomonas weihenstephanensis TaxID=1608994 RepID=UPI0019D348C1|nr:hypothetical protein [Pseudomonas weihenstephanensis]
MADTTKKVHGNSLDSDAPAIGYTLRDRDTYEVAKYGETTYGKKRYPDNYLKNEGVIMKVEASGSKREMYQWQHERILDYKTKHNGQRPRLNKNDY